jgi:type IV fimbrial biogenesis protein FimT
VPDGDLWLPSAMPRYGPRGFTLIEILTVLTLAGILAGLLAPSISTYLQRLRMRGVLDRFTTDLYHARMLATRSGERIHLRMEPGGNDCMQSYEIRYAATGEVLRRVDLTDKASTICLTLSGNATLSINSRGMPVGSARTIRVHSGAHADSLRISIIGRVNRLYSVPYAWALLAEKRFPDRQSIRPCQAVTEC